MPRPSDVTYGGTRFLTSREQPLKFSMFFAGIEKMLQNELSDADEFERSRTIVYQELGVFGKDILKPVWSAAAPQREWGSIGPRQVMLKDSIEAVRSRREIGVDPSIRVEMPWWGKYSIEGRDPLPDRAGRFKIVLPGGQVIYRWHVGAATVRAYSIGTAADVNGTLVTRDHHGQPTEKEAPPPIDEAAGIKRMAWSSDAYKELKASGQLEVLMHNIGQRIILESSLYATMGAGGNTSAIKQLVADFKKADGSRSGRQMFDPSAVHHRSHRTKDRLSLAKRRSLAKATHRTALGEARRNIRTHERTMSKQKTIMNRYAATHNRHRTAYLEYEKALTKRDAAEKHYFDLGGNFF